MSQVSPDARYVVTTINDPGRGQTDYQRRLAPQDLWSNYYIANFTNYRFLQVFYLTRGILAWYSRSAGVLQPLPGADDPRFVHTNAVWSPDGRFLVFARAEARDAYPEGSKPALQPNDPNETQIRYDLYRIPFDEGRGGTPVPIAGASANGMSNSFPKVSPDGRFIVFVKAKNGQLMRPDGKLYIVPVEGGEARLMRCNTPLMNSWHSFSPNGRWLVFSSKSRSPYTQLFLTHLDENGNDTPAVMIENSTAANRAANIPEFVNVAADGFQRIDAPVAEYYRLIDDASEAMNAGRHEQAIPLLKEALADEPGRRGGAQQLRLGPRRHRPPRRGRRPVPQGHAAEPRLPGRAQQPRAGPRAERPGGSRCPRVPRRHWPSSPTSRRHTRVSAAPLRRAGDLSEAIPHLQRGVELGPQNPMARANLCLALSMAGRAQEAVPHAEQAVALTGGQDPRLLDMLGRVNAQAGRLAEAADATRRAIDVASRAGDERLVRDLQARLSSYESAGATGSAESRGRVHGRVDELPAPACPEASHGCRRPRNGGGARKERPPRRRCRRRPRPTTPLAPMTRGPSRPRATASERRATGSPTTGPRCRRRSTPCRRREVRESSFFPRAATACPPRCTSGRASG